MQELKLPADAAAKLSRAIRKARTPGVVAVCLWCGHGYTKYDHHLEDEHFANVCPNAPPELRENAKKRLVSHHAG